MTPEVARAEFPVLATCTYLNSNSTGAFPRGARRAAEQYLDLRDRWRDSAWEGFFQEMAGYANDIAVLLGAPPSSVTLDTNVSTLLGRLLSCFDFRSRPRVVTSDLEFPNVELLLDAFLRYGCEPVVVPSRDGIAIDANAIAAAIDERTQLVVVSHATFTTGALTDLAPIVRRARSHGALVALDAYQTAGVVPLDVAALDVDVVFGGAKKWLCGANDSAFCYVRPSLVRELVPAATGWMATANAHEFGRAKKLADDARRMSGGTPSPLAALTSREGLRLLQEVGVPRIRKLSLARTARVIERADAMGITVATPREPDARGAIVTLRFPDSAEIVGALNRDGFVCSHRNGARVAPHYYNTDDEVERFMDALEARVHR